MQRYIDQLTAVDVSLRYAEREVRLMIGDADANPFDTNVLYLVAFPAGKELDQFATPRSVGIGL